MEKELKKKLEHYEDLIFEGEPINTKDFYKLKRQLLKGVPLISDDNGFWIFAGLTLATVLSMWFYFKKNKWI